jgi:hypothetical protein
MEDGTGGGLPTKGDDEFRPFVRRLPEFKFWHSATRAITISLFCSFFAMFDLPVFWPVLVIYWFILFFLTSTPPISGCIRRQLLIHLSAKTNSTHGQVPICAIHRWQDSLWREINDQHRRFNFCTRSVQGVHSEKTTMHLLFPPLSEKCLDAFY